VTGSECDDDVGVGGRKKTPMVMALIMVMMMSVCGQCKSEKKVNSRRPNCDRIAKKCRQSESTTKPPSKEWRPNRLSNFQSEV
jgi:hypothetical protein